MGAVNSTADDEMVWESEEKGILEASRLSRLPDLRLRDCHRIEKKGEGGFGTVWKVLYRPNREILAVKVIELENLSSEDREETFREIELLALLTQLGNQCVPRIFGKQIGETKLNLFMEYIDGPNLFDWIDEERAPESLREKVGLMLQLAQCFSQLHYLGIVHRDLKPENILVERRATQVGEETRLRLIDFGLSCLVKGQASRVAHEVYGTEKLHPFLTCEQTYPVVGTPRYEAPELLEKAPNLDYFQSDVYALGLVFFFLLKEHDLVDHDQEGPRLVSLARNASKTVLEIADEEARQMEGEADWPLMSEIYDLISKMILPDMGDRPPMDEVQGVLEDLLTEYL